MGAAEAGTDIISAQAAGSASAVGAEEGLIGAGVPAPAAETAAGVVENGMGAGVPASASMWIEGE
jgi:hypothetical protein